MTMNFLGPVARRLKRLQEAANQPPPPPSRRYASQAEINKFVKDTFDYVYNRRYGPGTTLDDIVQGVLKWYRANTDYSEAELAQEPMIWKRYYDRGVQDFPNGPNLPKPVPRGPTPGEIEAERQRQESNKLAAQEAERQRLVKAERDRIEGMFGPIQPLDPGKLTLARQMPSAIRDMALRGGSLQQPLLFPSIGSLRFRSPQTLQNMTIPVQQMYLRGLEMQGLGPSDIEEFLRQEQASTAVAPSPYSRYSFAPLRVQRGF